MQFRTGVQLSCSVACVPFCAHGYLSVGAPLTRQAGHDPCEEGGLLAIPSRCLAEISATVGGGGLGRVHFFLQNFRSWGNKGCPGVSWTAAAATGLLLRGCLLLARLEVREGCGLLRSEGVSSLTVQGCVWELTPGHLRTFPARCREHFQGQTKC